MADTRKQGTDAFNTVLLEQEFERACANARAQRLRTICRAFTTLERELDAELEARKKQEEQMDAEQGAMPPWDDELEQEILKRIVVPAPARRRRRARERGIFDDTPSTA